MEFVLIHRQLGPLPLEMLKKAVEIAKKFVVDPQEFVPGGKLIAAYNTLAQSAVVCIWEVPSLDALMPFLEQLNALGWETEIIPAEKMEVHIPKLEKMLAQMAGSQPIILHFPLFKPKPKPFTNKKLAKLRGVSINLARKITYCLRKMGAITTVGKGKELIYEVS